MRNHPQGQVIEGISIHIFLSQIGGKFFPQSWHGLQLSANFIEAPRQAHPHAADRHPIFRGQFLVGQVVHQEVAHQPRLPRLERAGLIERRRSTRDRRRQGISLTESGSGELEALMTQVRQLERHMASRFSKAELDQFLGFLQRMYS